MYKYKTYVLGSGTQHTMYNKTYQVSPYILTELSRQCAQVRISAYTDYVRTVFSMMKYNLIILNIRFLEWDMSNKVENIVMGYETKSYKMMTHIMINLNNRGISDISNHQ